MKFDEAKMLLIACILLFYKNKIPKKLNVFTQIIEISDSKQIL